MRCTICKGNIAAGVEAQKMIVEYAQPDGTTRIFGYTMSDGPLSTATGQLVRAWHYKHFHQARKREARGDAVTGRVVGGTPTGYDIAALVLSRDEFLALGITEAEARERTAQLSARVDQLREVARSIGKGVGDATVLEAFWAREHSGPYPHNHDLRLETYQLRAHLVYAHGWDQLHSTVARSGIHAAHDELHAAQSLADIKARRDADLGHIEPAERDWREQLHIDVDDFKAGEC